MARPRAEHGRTGGAGGVGAMTLLLSAMALGTALIAGGFYAFSDFIMRSLGAIPNPHGAAAMVSINRVILRASFVPLLIGLGPLSLALAVWLSASGAETAAIWAYVASGLYVIGVLGVTMLGNVPMNNTLDRARHPEGYWATYRPRWTRLNTLRTAAAALASLFYMQAALAIAANPVT